MRVTVCYALQHLEQVVLQQNKSIQDHVVTQSTVSTNAFAPQVDVQSSRDKCYLDQLMVGTKVWMRVHVFLQI